MALEINDLNYEEVVATDRLVLIDFWAQWCGPCKALSPTIDELAKEFADSVVVGKVDVDNNADDIVSKFGVRSVPTILLIKDGKVVDKCVGAVPKHELIEKINSNL